MPSNKNQQTDEPLCRKSNEKMFNWKFKREGVIFTSNYSMISDNDRKRLKAKYFLFSETELKEKKRNGLKMTDKSWKSLTHFVNHTKCETFGIRILPALFSQKLSALTGRVLYEDFFEIMPLLLKKHKLPHTKYDKMLNNYKEAEKVTDVGRYFTMTAQFFVEMLDHCDIPRSSVAIIPCVIHSKTWENSIREAFEPIISINRKGEAIMDRAQANLYIFVSTICGYDWTEESQKNEVDEFKKVFFEEMKKYSQDQDGEYSTKSSIDKCIADFKSHEIFSKLKKPECEPIPNNDYLFSTLDPMAVVCLSSVKSSGSHFGLKCFPNFPQEVPIYLARIITIAAWTGIFCMQEIIRNQAFVARALANRAPENMRSLIATKLEKYFYVVLPPPDDPYLQSTDLPKEMEDLNLQDSTSKPSTS